MVQKYARADSKIDKTRACDICGKHNKIVLIFNDKCYCKDCCKDVFNEAEEEEQVGG